MTIFAVIRSTVAITAVLLAPLRSEATETELVVSEWPTAGWRSSTPEEQGMGSGALSDLVDFGASHQLESLLVARHGVIVVEAFYAPFRAGVKHRMYSATKSVIGTLVGTALKDGHLDSPHRRMIEFFPGQQIANLDERKSAITIEHLLDMTSGLS
jgi:CubicO group peptidase (beta-lactamase class C family)